MKIGGVGWVVYVVTDSRELTVWRQGVLVGLCMW